MVAQIGRTVLKLADVAKRLKARPKTKKTTSKGARLVKGAGDQSDPGVGRYRAGQKQLRGGATQTAKDAMSDAEKAKLARQRSAKGSLTRAQTLKKGSLAQLSDEYDKLTSSAKRAHRMKGSKSKFYKVFKARGMKPLKTGGKVITYKMTGGQVVGAGYD